MSETTVFGINLPWLDGAYGHDMAPNERLPTWPVDFKALRSYRPLVEARELGFEAVRVWLCENGEGIVTEGGRPARPHPRLVEGVQVLQECAGLLGVRIYWTLLDGNSWRREGDGITHAVMADPESCARFAEGVAAALVRKMDPAVTFGVEVVNEPEALSTTCVNPREEGVPWEVLARSIRTIGDAIRSAQPGTVVTAGTLHTMLDELYRWEPRLDAVDLHAYHLGGGLPTREEVAKATGDKRVAEGAVPVFAGECGVPDDAPPEARGALKHYVYNARRNGYDAAFLWRLESVLVDAKAEGRPVTELGSEFRAIVEEVRAG